MRKKLTGYGYKHLIMQHKGKWDIAKYAYIKSSIHLVSLKIYHISIKIVFYQVQKNVF